MKVKIFDIIKIFYYYKMSSRRPTRVELVDADIHYLTKEIRMQVYDPDLYENLNYNVFPFNILKNNSGNFERRIYVFAWESLTNVHSKYLMDKMNEISLSGREPDLKDDEIIRKDWARIENVEFGKIKNQLEPIVKLWHIIVTSGMQNGYNIRSSKMIRM